MKRSRRIGWVLSTAVAAVSIGAGASTILAQNRVGSDGRALDANNRVGSGGVNEAGNRGPAHVTGNQIVTGNVTGGQQFRGNVPYTDPFSFRGNVAGAGVDRFVRQSAGVPTGGIASNNNAGNIQPFYGSATTVERPPGFIEQSPSGGYIPAPLISREAGDLRLGRPLESPVALPRPGQLILPGPVNPETQQQSVITASPLYGVRMWNFEEQDDQQFLNGLNQPGRQRLRLDDQTLEQMRQELEQSEGEAGEDAEKTGEDRDRPDPRMSLRLDTPVDAPRNDPLSREGWLDDKTQNQPLGADVRTGQKTTRRLLTAPEQQSTQYAELRRRLQRYNRLPESMEDLEAHRRYNEQVRAMQEKESKEARARTEPTDPERKPTDPSAGGARPGDQQQPGAVGPGTDTTGARQQQQQTELEKFGLPDLGKRSREIVEGKDPGPQTMTQVPGSVREQDPAREKPLQVTSLATGVQAKGLADFLREAEGLMKQGKFYSALDQYDLAEQVAPNNPMVPLGRAIAELGAGYYNRADQHLREAFTKDPALLMGQYDLRSFLGEERLEFLNTDLKAIANRETREPRPVFLLAFLEYSVGTPQKAAAYLDLAEKRAGGGDKFYSTVREHWNLSSKPAVDDANK